MTLFHGANIVTNGLVLFLDAANPRSYSSTATGVWKDLSGRGNSGTLTNTPIYSPNNAGYLWFNQDLTFVSPQLFYVNNASADFNYGTGDFAVELWLYPIYPLQTQYVPTIYTNHGDGDWNTTGTGMRLQYGEVLANSQAPIFTYTPALQLLAWQQHVVTRVGTTMSAYINGLLVGSVSGASFVVGDSTDRPALATSDGIPTGREWFGGYMSICRVYKGQGLTSNLVIQNFNAHRGRYGI